MAPKRKQDAGGTSGSKPRAPIDHIAASYRYLRLSMVVVVATLGASLAIERIVHECQLGSISAYYYGPVHSVFIGALITIGVVLIALRGSDQLEDLLFNIAGALALVVALVPTKRPDNLCREGQVNVLADDLVSNNIPAVAIGFIVAIGIAFGIAYRQHKIHRRQLPKPTWVGLAIGLALLGVGLGWYLFFGDSFRRWAHGATAIAMFVFIWLAVLVNAGWPRPVLRWAYRKIGVPIPASLTSPTRRRLRYLPWYRAVSVFMPAAALVVVVLMPSSSKVFWLEVAEIFPFAGFWTLQTLEAWETGLTQTAPPD